MPAKYPVHLSEERETQFNDLWRAYPKAGRKAKGEARRAFSKIMPTDEQFEQMFQAAKAYNKDATVLRGFCKHMSTWLNQGCWEDYEPDEPDESGQYGREETVDF